MRAIIDRRLALAERSATVLVRGAEIWTYGAQSKKLLRYAGIAGTTLTPAVSLPVISTKDGAITWDGNHLLVADRSTRRVFRVDATSGQETLAMDPATISFGNFDPALLVSDSTIGDIAWHDGLLIVAVQAGYSSAIYGIDLSKMDIADLSSELTEPRGLTLDAERGLWTTDWSTDAVLRIRVEG